MRKRKKKLSKGARGVGALVVGATGASILHSAMPSGTGTALDSASSGFSSMVGPAATVYGAGMVMKQMKHLDPKRLRKCVRVTKRIRKRKGGRR